MPDTHIRRSLSATELHAVLLAATGLEPEWTHDAGRNSFGWLRLPSPDLLLPAAKALSGKVRLCAITPYAQERDDEKKRRCIAYHFADGNVLLTLTIPLYDPETAEALPVPSITPWFRNADWNEREFHEMFGIEVLGHPDLKRLFLDERLDAGIMAQLIPFSAMANSAGTKTLWEQIMAAKCEEAPHIQDAALTEPAFTPVERTREESI